jgi:ParB-like chromosome segregation protein Spo0J
VKSGERFTSHHDEALIENVCFLLAGGLHMDLVAKRLGKSRGQIEKMLDRRDGGWRSRYPGTLTAFGDSS